MAEIPAEDTPTVLELLGTGRRHLAVRDYSAATETLAKACELLAKEHGDMSDKCAEAYLWYGKALLGLSRIESDILGDGVPGVNKKVVDNDDEEEENIDDPQEDDQSVENADKEQDKETEKCESDSVNKDEPASSSAPSDSEEKMNTTNGDGNDESAVDLGTEDDVDTLQLAWEMLDLARSILSKRVDNNGGDPARALLADAYLSLGEVALESETYDKAVEEMASCLNIQKLLYRSNDRRIAETHYQIGLANSLASNFEDAITHFKNAVNILETRIKTLEDPNTAKDDIVVKKYFTHDPLYSVESEIKELKELLPEIREKINDMMDYKAETLRRLRLSLCGNGDANENGANGSGANKSGANESGASTSASNGGEVAASSTSSASVSATASDISHLVKRKRKSTEVETEATQPKRPNISNETK